MLEEADIKTAKRGGRTEENLFVGEKFYFRCCLQLRLRWWFMALLPAALYTRGSWVLISAVRCTIPLRGKRYWTHKCFIWGRLVRAAVRRSPRSPRRCGVQARYVLALFSGRARGSVRPGRGIKAAARGINVKLNFFTSFHFLK